MDKFFKYGVRLVVAILLILIFRNVVFTQTQLGTQIEVPINIVLEDLSSYEDTSCMVDLIVTGRLSIRDVEATIFVRDTVVNEFIDYDGIIRIIQNVIPELTEYKFYIVIDGWSVDVTNQYLWIMSWYPDGNTPKLAAYANPKQ